MTISDDNVGVDVPTSKHMFVDLLYCLNMRIRFILSVFVYLSFVYINVNCSNGNTSDGCWDTCHSIYGDDYDEHHLHGIHGIADDHIYAVGSDTIVHYNGEYWDVLESTQFKRTLYDVWTNANKEVFVASVNTVYHNNGSAWSEMNLEHDADEVNIFGIWGTGGGEIFAVGSKFYFSRSDTDYIGYYDGFEWRDQSTGINCTLSDVWGTSKSNVYAVGECGILHYNGLIWESVQTGTQGSYIGIWGSSESDIYAVGGSVTHYSIDSWEEVDTGMETGFGGVSGNSANNVFLVGWRGVAANYNGEEWIDVSVREKDRERILLSDVWLSPDGSVYAVGFRYNVNAIDSYGTIWKYSCR